MPLPPEVIWVSGYPRVDGVNAPRTEPDAATQEVEAVVEQEHIAQRPDTPMVNTDLRAGRFTNTDR